MKQLKFLYFLLFSFYSFILSLIICLLFHDSLNNLLGKSFDSIWLILIPIGGFLLGFYNILLNWNSRFENYKNISRSNIIHSSVSSPLSAFLYLIGISSALGLLLGLIFGRLVAVYFLIYNYFSEVKKISYLNYIIHQKNYLKSIKAFTF